MSVFKSLISTVKFSRTKSSGVQHEHTIKSKNSSYFHLYLMYKHLYNMALHLDVAFLLSVSIVINIMSAYEVLIFIALDQTSLWKCTNSS